MNLQVLAKKGQLLKQMFNGDPAIIDELISYIESLSPFDSFRIPLNHFEKLFKSGSGQIPEVLMSAVRSDIMSMEWHLICDACTGYIFSNGKYSVYEGGEMLCPFCCRYVTPDFQNNIEVTFSLHPSLGIIEPEYHADAESYAKHFFSKSYINGGIIPDIKEGLITFYRGVAPGKTVAVNADIADGMQYNLFSIDTQTLYRLHSGAPDAVPAEFAFSERNNQPIPVNITAGENSLMITNNLDRSIGVCMLTCDDMSKFDAVRAKFPLKSLPFLSGARLLTDPHFIRMFGKQELTDNFSFRMGNLTILFTDLKSSTNIYSEIGDLAAYNLVGKHFDILMKVIHDNGGTAVKTVGDAVMAVFHDRVNAVRAAIQMHERMDSFSVAGLSIPIKLKIGLHYGTVLAVNANQKLDYFGQAVNIAARVQSLAGGGELCLSESVLDFDTVRFLENGSYSKKRVRKILKGVQHRTTVYHYKISV